MHMTRTGVSSPVENQTDNTVGVYVATQWLNVILCLVSTISICNLVDFTTYHAIFKLADLMLSSLPGVTLVDPGHQSA